MVQSFVFHPAIVPDVNWYCIEARYSGISLEQQTPEIFSRAMEYGIKGGEFFLQIFMEEFKSN